MSIVFAFSKYPSGVKAALLPNEDYDFFDLQAMTLRKLTPGAMWPRKGQYIAMTLVAWHIWARCQQTSLMRQVKALTCTPPTYR